MKNRFSRYKVYKILEAASCVENNAKEWIIHFDNKTKIYFDKFTHIEFEKGIYKINKKSLKTCCGEVFVMF